VSTVIVQQTRVVAVTRQTSSTVEMTTRGPQGIPGEAEGATFTATAATTLHGRRAVAVNDAGQLYHPDTSTPTDAPRVVGIAVTAANNGADALVRVGGQMTDSGWAWTGGPVFVGPSGHLTQTPAPDGWLLQVARAISPTTLIVDVDDAILR
jgi:hypothetical protein